MTTAWVKDLKGQNLEDLRDLINTWWMRRGLQEEIAMARVVSLYRKGTQTERKTIAP